MTRIKYLVQVALSYKLKLIARRRSIDLMLKLCSEGPTRHWAVGPANLYTHVCVAGRTQQGTNIIACSLFVMSFHHKGEHYHCSLFVECYVPIFRQCSVSTFRQCSVSIFSLCSVSLLCEVFILCYVRCLDASDPRSARVARFAR